MKKNHIIVIAFLINVFVRATNNLLEIDSFKLQPTLEKEDFYKQTGLQQSLYYVEFAKVRFVNTMLDRFIHNDIINADSVIFEGADISVYQDKSAPNPDFAR